MRNKSAGKWWCGVVLFVFAIYRIYLGAVIGFLFF